MTIREITAKSILRRHKRLNTWFLSYYGLNLYRSCAHSCVYCDGRTEKYWVKGKSSEDVIVKVNALEILAYELEPEGTRIPLKRCYIMMGGGVGDCYQPAEKEYGLSAGALKLFHALNLPVHVLTKSSLVKRDIDILEKINQSSRAIVSFSFSTVDDDLSRFLEPDAPLPSQRFKVIHDLKKRGIPCGMFLLPIVPFLTDNPEQIKAAFDIAAESGIDFVIFGGMTLKRGRQKDYFFSILEKAFPKLLPKYQNIYQESRWGEFSQAYSKHINNTIYKIARNYDIPVRIPTALFVDTLDMNDRVITILEHLDYLQKLRNQKSPFGYAAFRMSKLNEPISTWRDRLCSLKGIGPLTESIILEILDTGTCARYEYLMG